MSEDEATDPGESADGSAGGTAVVGNRWILVRPLAEGGMGQVWVARHRVTGQLAALKILRLSHTAGDPYERFMREAQAANHVGHPGVAQVYDADCDPERQSCYLAMELLEGRTLREQMEDPVKTPRELLQVIRNLLDPLAAAHQKGIVHRDLKPANVFVQYDDPARTKLLDFGIARPLQASHVTLPGTVMGTPHYMSPEQATDSRNVATQADVWSVGAMLYEAVAGRPPFRGDSPHGVIVAACTHDLESLDRIKPDVDPALARLVSRCLEKDPSHRPADAAALIVELDQVLRRNSLPASRPVSMRGPRAHQKSDPSPPSKSAGTPSAALARWRGRGGVPVLVAAALLPLGLCAWLAVRASGDHGLSWLVTVWALAAIGLLAVVAFARQREARKKSVRPVPEAGSVNPGEPSANLESPRRGPENAPVEILLFSDLLDPQSRRMQRLVQELEAQHIGNVALIHYSVPRSNSRKAQLAAEAACEVLHQAGHDGFWQFRDYLLDTRKRPGPIEILEWARGLELNTVSFRHALRANVHGDRVAQDVAFAEQLGLDRTPALVIDGRIFYLNARRFVVRDALEAALRRARATRDDHTHVGGSLGPDHKRVEVQQIVVAWSALPGASLSVPRSRAEAAGRAERILARAKDPQANFQDLAIRFSDDATQTERVSLHRLPDPLRRVVHHLDAGQISELIETDQGFHIVRREG